MDVKDVTLGVMIGKAVKLAAGFDNTHSYQVTMDRDFVTDLARQVGCSQQALSIIQEINMARQLITDLPCADYELLKPIIVDKCLQTCKRIYSGRLEFILLDSLL